MDIIYLMNKQTKHKISKSLLDSKSMTGCKSAEGFN